MQTNKRMNVAAVIALCAAALTFSPYARAQNANTAEQTGPYPSLEIRDVTVIDGSGAPAFGPVNVFIRGNRIERVVPSDSISRNRAEDVVDHALLGVDSDFARAEMGLMGFAGHEALHGAPAFIALARSAGQFRSMRRARERTFRGRSGRAPATRSGPS